MICEFHFQEGFSGETVVITVDGKETARFNAKTRMQLGLAKIEPIKLTSGQRVSISLSPSGPKADYHFKPADKFVKVNLVNQQLEISPVPVSPGYV